MLYPAPLAALGRRRKGAASVPADYEAPRKAAAGAKEYGETCVMCNGGPGISPRAIARGLNPIPPRLYNGRWPTAKSPSRLSGAGVIEVSIGLLFTQTRLPDTRLHIP
jgi:hypothetical protein